MMFHSFVVLFYPSLLLLKTRTESSNSITRGISAALLFLLKVLNYCYILIHALSRMVIRSTAKYDISKIIDPTIALWSANDPLESSNKQTSEPTVEYWFNTKGLDSFQKNNLSLEEPSCIIEDVASTSATTVALDKHSQAERFQEHIEFNFKGSFLHLAGKFWGLQKSFAHSGLQASALTITKEFFQMQNKSLTSGLDNLSVMFFQEFWKCQHSFDSTGLQNPTLIAAHIFMSTQEALLCTGLSDKVVSYFQDFWKIQEPIDVSGTTDGALSASREFWKLQNSLTSITGQETERSEYKIFPKVNRCFTMHDGSSAAIDDNDIALLRIEELNFKMTDKFTREKHLEEISKLNKVIERLQAEKSQLMTSQQVMINQLVRKDKQLEVVDEMISHNIDLELANKELSGRWAQAVAQLKIADSIERHNYELISTNANLTSEKQHLISRFAEIQNKLISPNANLHTLVVTLEDATKTNFEESCKLKNIIEMLRKKDAENYSRPSSNESFSIDFGIGSARSKNSRHRMNSSKEFNNSSLQKAPTGSNLDSPASAGMIYVNS